MLTSHRFSCSLGTISLYFEDEALIGLDLEGSAGCGERLMAQLARHGIDPAAFRPEATPAALAVEQWLINYAAGMQPVRRSRRTPEMKTTGNHSLNHKCVWMQKKVRDSSSA